MDSARKIAPLDESSNRQIWVGWGSGVMCLGLAYLVGGLFFPYALVFLGASMALRGHLPGLFAKHIDAKIIEGIPYRREESIKSWIATLVICLMLAWGASSIHRRVAPEHPDLAATILNPIKKLIEQQQKAPAPTVAKVDTVESHPQPPPRSPNFAYLAPGLWLNSDTWDFMITRRGPDAIFNVEVLFVDTVKQQEIVKGKTEITADDINSYQSILRYPELDAHGYGSVFAVQFLWKPIKADHEHYDITISWRDGSVGEDLAIERVNGNWFWAMVITDRRTRNILVDCKDKGFPKHLSQQSCFPKLAKNE